jgi:hypothetical protein
VSAAEDLAEAYEEEAEGTASQRTSEAQRLAAARDPGVRFSPTWMVWSTAREVTYQGPGLVVQF